MKKKLLPLSVTLAMCLGIMSFGLHASKNDLMNEEETDSVRSLSFSFLEFSPEVHEMIIQNMGIEDFVSLTKVNTYFYQFIDQEHLLHAAFLNHFSSMQHSELVGEKKPHLSYADLFKAVAFLDYCSRNMENENNLIRQTFSTHPSAPENWEEAYSNFMKSYIRFDRLYPLLTLGSKESFLSALEENMENYYAFLSNIILGDLKSIPYVIIKNNLRFIPPEIARQRNLEEAYLSGHNIVALPPEIGDLPILEDLNLTFSPISVLPPEIVNLENLQSLLLIHSPIFVLPPQIEKLTNLRKLILDKNFMEELPSEIGSLTNLTILNVDNTLIKVLPSTIGNLENLISLSIGGNCLEVLPPEIGNLTKVKSLYISDNPLKELPSTIGQMSGLERLYMNHTRITIQGFPIEIINLKELKELQIWGTPLQKHSEHVKGLLPHADVHPAPSA